MSKKCSISSKKDSLFPFSCYFSKENLNLNLIQPLYMKNFRISFIIALLCAISTTLSAQEKTTQDSTKLAPLGTYKGLLWEISGNGIKSPSYLYGTMHVSKKVAFHLSDTFFVALKSADIVALETNPENWMKELFGSDLFKDMMMSFDNSNINSISDLYGQAFYIQENTEDVYKKALRDKNNVANHMLFRFNHFSGSADYEENTYLDMFIFQIAKRYKKKVTSLEDLQKAVEFMIRSRLEKDEDDEEEEDTPYYDWRESGKSMNELMEESYRKGDLNTLDSLSRFAGNQSKMFHKFMIIERNKIMAESIDSLMRKGLVAFNGIGAAHLPGEEGVIELLRQKGYTLRPISSHTSKIAAKEKKKINKTYVKEEFKTQKTVDGVITTKSPGKLHLIPFEKNIELYLYPEMANGVYYSLYRINHHKFIHGNDHNYMYKKIDSILYENIPGNILKKEYITTNGYPAIHIKNKSRRGDYQEHRLIFTPLETILLKVGGTGDYLKKNDVDEFFESFTYTPKKTSGITSPTSGGFEINVPGQLLTDTKWDEEKNNNVRDYQVVAYDKASDDYYYVMKSSYYDFNYIEEDTFELNMFAHKFSKEYEYDIISKSFLQNFTHPGLDVVLEHEKNGKVYARFIKAGPTYYMLMQYTSKNEKNNTFFNSFKIKPYLYEGDSREVKDTILSYKVNTVGEYPDYTEVLSKYPFLKKLYLKELEKNNEFNELDRHFEFFYPQTGEIVSLDVYKESKYTQRISDERETPIEEIDGYETYIVLKDTISFSADSNTYYSFSSLADTNSTRIIWLTYIEKGSMSYTLSANVDQNTGPTAFVSSFFNTFQPLPDTIIGTSVYTDKRALFFEDILSKDSATVVNAAKAMNYVKFENEDFEKLLMLRDSVTIEDEEIAAEFKQQIFREISYLDSDEVAKYLSELYVTHEDSTTLHLKILKALANTETSLSYKLLKKHLLENTPLTDDKWELNSLFYALNDSLELAATLFPDLLELNRYPEYEVKMYDLLVELIDSAAVDKTIHKEYMKEILLRANNELKRELNSEEKNSAESASKSYTWDSDAFNFESLEDFSFSYSGSESTEDNINGKLLTYTKLLLPFYNEEKKVQEYFEKLNKLENHGSQLVYEALKIKNNIPGNDTLWNHIAKENKYRVPEIYKTLEELKKLDLLDSTYKTQTALLNSFLASEIDLDEDSTVFLKKVLVEIPNKEAGYVYFYKYKRKDAKKWVLFYSGLQPIDENKLSTENDYSDTKTLSKKDDIEKEIEEIIFNLKLEGRERVVDPNNYYYNFF